MTADDSSTDASSEGSLLHCLRHPIHIINPCPMIIIRDVHSRDVFAVVGAVYPCVQSPIILLANYGVRIRTRVGFAVAVTRVHIVA